MARKVSVVEGSKGSSVWTVASMGFIEREGRSSQKDGERSGGWMAEISRGGWSSGRVMSACGRSERRRWRGWDGRLRSRSTTERTRAGAEQVGGLSR